MNTPLRSSLLLAAATLVAVSSASAATYYWDNNGTTAGFGTAGSPADVWGTNTDWSTDTTGVAAPSVINTTITDTLNFGTNTAGQGLAAGSITVTGTTQGFGAIIFGSQSGSISLNGGTLNLGTNATITVNNNQQNFIGSTLTGNVGLLTIDGTGTGSVVLNNGSPVNSFTGNILVKSGATLQLGNNNNWNHIPDASSVTIDGTLLLRINGTETIDALNGAGIVKGNNLADTLQVGSSNGTGTFTGKIQDGTVAFSFAKTGTGTQTLSGANTYTGKTTINNGTLSVSSINSVVGGVANSNLGAPITVANGTIGMGSSGNTGTLLYTGAGETTDRVINLAGTTGGATIDQSGSGLLKFSSALTATGVGAKTLTLQGSTAGTGEIAGAIVDSSSGATSLTKAGTGTWTLSGANTYTGGTAVNGGTLNLANSNALQNSATTLTSPGTLAFDSAVATHAFTLASLAGSGNLSLQDNAANAVSLAVGGNNASTTYSGVISGSGSLIKNGTGTLTFTGSSNNSFNAVTVNAGVLADNTGASTINRMGTGTILVNTGATLNLASNRATTYGALTLNGGGASGLSGALLLGGNSQFSGVTFTSITLGSSATIGTANAAGNGNTITATNGINLGANTLTFNPLTPTGALASESLTIAGAISGTGGIIHAGPGQTTLNSANTYTGTTAVNAGTLVVASGGSIKVGASGVTVASGATLLLNGKLALTAIDTTNGNIVNSGGTITFASGSKVVIGNLLDGLTGNTYQLISGSGSYSTASSLGFDFTSSTKWGSASLDSTGLMTLAAVPEPSTYCLIGAGALAAVAFVRRRRKQVA